MLQKEEIRDNVVLVGLNSPVLKEDSATEESMDELAALVETAGGEAVGIILQNRPSPDPPRTFIGEGKVAEVQLYCENTGADMVIFDNDLSPSQQRVLTELLGVQVLDRCGLILDIFAQRAKTKEGRLQVELAQYRYLLPRLIGMWSHLERQGGTSSKRPHWFQRPRRDPAGDRPPPDPQEDRQGPPGPGGGPPGAGHPAPAPAEERDPGGGHRGLHQRGEIHPAQSAYGSIYPGQ